MNGPSRAWGDRRRVCQEEGYEKLIVSSAQEIMAPETSPERRARAQESLLNACVKVGAFHSMDAHRLYWAALRKARELREGTQIEQVES